MSEERMIVHAEIQYGWNSVSECPTYALCLGIERCPNCEELDIYIMHPINYEAAVNYGRYCVGHTPSTSPKFDEIFRHVSFPVVSEAFQGYTHLWKRTLEASIPVETRMFEVVSMDEWLQDDVAYAIAKWDKFVANEVAPAERASMAEPTATAVAKYLERKGRTRNHLEHELHALIEDIVARKVDPPYPQEAGFIRPFPVPLPLLSQLSAYCCKRGVTIEHLILNLLNDALTQGREDKTA